MSFPLKPEIGILSLEAVRIQKKIPHYTFISFYCVKITSMLPELGGSTLAMSFQYWRSTSMSCSFIWSCSGYNREMVENLSVEPLSHVSMSCLRKCSKNYTKHSVSEAFYLENTFVDTQNCSFNGSTKLS